jgi:hypothetical protein
MSLLLKLRDAVINNAALPLLTDFGYLPQSQLQELYKLKTAFGPNEAPAGGSPVLSSTATGPRVPSFSGGILTVPDAGVSSEGTKYTLPVTISGQTYTYALLCRWDTSTRSFYFMRPNSGFGTALFATLGSGIYTPAVIWNNGITRQISCGPSISFGTWFSLVLSVSATNMKCIVNNGALYNILYADNGGVPSNTSAAQTVMGSNSPAATFAQQLHGLYGFVAAYDRAMPESEMRALARGIAAFATRKSITLG